MSTLKISLPDSMRASVEAVVREGGYSTASEYVRELIRNDQNRKGREKLEALLVEGVGSGESLPVDQAFWTDMRADLTARLKQAGGEEKASD